MVYRTVLKVSLVVMSCAAIGCDSGDDDSNAGGSGGAGGAMTTGGTGGAPGSGGAGGTSSGGTGAAGSAGMMTSGAGGMSSGGTGAAGSGSGGMAGDGTGGMMADDAGAGMGGMGGMDLGEGDGQDVITIGDSWMNLNDTTGIEQSLEAISGRDYRNYGIPGTIVLSDDPNQIPGQYYGAVEEDADIKTVIMTGGGNDTLQGGCLPGDCAAKIEEVSERLALLMADMVEDGVQDLFYVGYAQPAGSLGAASTEYARVQLPMLCNADSMPRCHFVDTQDEVSGHISGDGIHPTQEGYDIVGQMVWDAMVEAGVRR